MPQINATITWGAVIATPPIQGYKIERCNVQPMWAVVATVGPEVTSYTDPNLTPATNYMYQVRAFNAFGDGPPKAAAGYKNTGGLPAAPETVTFDFTFV